MSASYMAKAEYRSGAISHFPYGCGWMYQFRLHYEFGGCIPLAGMLFPHDPVSFRQLEEWQQAAALEVIHGYIKEGKVLGPFPASTRHCSITGHSLFFYPSFVVLKSSPGANRWVLNAPSIIGFSTIPQS